MSIFVETKNATRILNSAEYCVKSGFNLAVVGAPGTGKSTICNRLDETLSATKTVLRLTAIKSPTNRTGTYLKLLLRELVIASPGSLEMCWSKLERSFAVIERPVILLINEAQNLNLATLRGLKNIWEISDGKLSILMFGLTDGNFQRALDGSEIGDRLVVEEMTLLDDPEILTIAKEKFGLKFKGKASSIFCETVRGLPSKIAKLAFSLKSIRNFDNVVDEEALQQSRYLEIRRMMRLAKVDTTSIAQEMNLEGTRVSVSEVNNVLAGKETKNKETIDTKLAEIGRKFGVR